MSVEKSILEDEFGPFWTPDQSMSADLNTTDGFAAQFAALVWPTISNIVKSKTNSGTVVHLVWSDDDSLNAFAGAVSRSDREYVIGINKGAIVKLQKLLQCPEFKSLVLPSFPILGKFGDNTITWFAIYAALAWLLLHEFAHVARGHVGYLARTSAPTVQHAIFEITLAAIPIVGLSEERRLCENDADTYAGRLVASVILHQVNSIIARYPNVSHDDIRSELVTLTGCALHCLFRLFESAGAATSKFYPEPMIRCGIVNTQFWLGMESYKALKPMANIVNGFGIANDFCHRVGLGYAQYSVADAYSKWSLDQLPRLQTFHQDLDEYRIVR